MIGSRLVLLLTIVTFIGVGHADKHAQTGTQEDHSLLRTKDPLSLKSREFFSAMTNKDFAFFESFFADTVKIEINGLTITGKEQYIGRLRKIAEDLFATIEFKWIHSHTNYFAPDAVAWDGRTMAEHSPDPMIWSNTWTVCKAKGLTTGSESEVPMHIDFRWHNGKVIQMLGYYDPTFMKLENQAWESARE